MDIKQFIKLAPFTTLQVGGPARWFAEIHNDRELIEALEFASRESLPVLILGGGSNLLISDAGFPGLVIRIDIRGIEWGEEGGIVTAGAGEPWDAFVEAAVERNLAGIECLSGIPGLAGGTPIQNVGAYGQEVSRTIRSVRVYDRLDCRFLDMSNSDCGFGYRTSILNTTERDRFIVLSVTYGLEVNGQPRILYPDLQGYFADRSEPPSLIDVRRAVLEIRRAKGMVIDPHDPDSRSAGSFFKNPIVSKEKFAAIEAICRACGLIGQSENVPNFPAGGGEVKIPAAWLIEKAGFEKGYRRRRAAISSKHTLAIVNLGNATAAEILELAAEISDRVEAIFGIRLQPEPLITG
ncbi:MAG: UDP-N-acetylmuramate dehydrogenase [Acidobacteriota bacterium]|nr:MAG: UDP-N-acetylmuramate dehydrogenase [Acidobacteriota bacterium]